jgi:hypothetical protein
MAKWLPLALRISFAISIWLVVAPLLTNVLYHGWMVRPSSILTRWKRELILTDIVSGAVTVAIIIISFLSLMSFADFLRVHWQQRPRDQLARQQQDGLPQGDNEGRDGQGGTDTDEKVHIENLDRKVIEFLKTKMGDSDSFSDESNDSLDGDAHVRSESFHEAFGEMRSSCEPSQDFQRFPNDGSLASIGDIILGDVRNDVMPDIQDDRGMDGNQENAEDSLDGIDNETVAEEEFAENELIPGDDQNDENEVLDHQDIGALNGPQEPGIQNDNNAPVFDPLDPFLQDDQVVSFSFDPFSVS